MHRHIRSEIASAATAALAICCLAVALLAPASARADAAQVTVVSPGGKQQTLALEALAGSEDVVNKPYVLRGGGGETTVTVTGFSLAALIDAAGADPYSFSYLEVQRPAGGTVQLSREQALDPGAFADGPPVVYATAAGTAFLRPASGADDINAADSFEAPQGISVVLRKGTALRARAEASTVKTQPGKLVRFKAIVEQAGSGEQLEFSWTFDDGHRASGERVQHRYAKPGSYDVVLGVTSSGDEAGASAVVTIQVGEPKGGPDRKGGGSNRAEDAPDHGVAEAPSPGLGSGAGSGFGPPESAAPSAPAPSPAPVPEPAPEVEPQPAPEPDPAGEQVSGELLTAPAEPAPEVEAEQVAARRGQLDEGGGEGGLPSAAWGTLATLGLLGSGALLEARGLLGRRRGGIA